jgi:gliding motility-associated-like protein
MQNIKVLGLVLSFLIHQSSSLSQVLSFNYHFNEGRQSITQYNPYVCHEIATLHLAAISDLNDWTILNGEIYGISPLSEILKYNPATFTMDSIFRLDRNNGCGIANNQIDSLFVFTSNGRFFKYNIFDQNYDSFVIDSGLIGKMTYYDGRLFVGNEAGLTEISTADGSVVRQLVGLPDSLGLLYAVAVNQLSCEDVSLIVLGKRNNLDTITFVYEYNFGKEEFRYLCNTDLFIWALADLPVDYDCTLLVDADRDQSGGWLPIHYRQPNVCGSGWSYVTDRDPYVYSSVGRIDSLVVRLAEGVVDVGSEYLDLESDPAYTVSGNQSSQIAITAGTFSDYELALSRLRYFHSGTSPSSGIRQVQITAHRLDRISDTARCEIPIYSKPNAGEGKAIAFCALDEFIDIQDYRSSEADVGGSWQGEVLISLSQPGIHESAYIVSSEHCGSDTAWFRVEIYDEPQVSLGEDTVVCDGSSLVLETGVNDGRYTCLWEDGSTDHRRVISESGEYAVTITNGPCEVILSKSVRFESEISSGLPDSVIMCAEGVTLQALSSPAYRYVWSTGEMSTDIRVSASGTYWLEMGTDECLIRDTVEVRLYQLTLPDVPDVLSSCGEPILIDLGDLPGGVQLLWNNGHIGNRFLADQSGHYSYELILGPCSLSDTIEVSILQLRSPDLGQNLVACDTQTVILQAGQGWDSYRWSTGSVEEFIRVTESGVYSVEVEQSDCQFISTVEVVFRTCRTCVVFVPGAVTPNGDGVNDYLEIFSNCSLQDFSAEIYDRWGSLVYRSEDMRLSWPETRTMEGVYIGVLKYKEEDGYQQLKAYEIQVIR